MRERVYGKREGATGVFHELRVGVGEAACVNVSVRALAGVWAAVIVRLQVWVRHV